MQLFVHQWDEQRATWNADATAFTQGTVTPKRIVNGSLFVFGSNADSATSDGNSPLAAGRYRISVYVDQRHRIAEDPTAMLDERDLKGDINLQAKWLEGFKQAEIISFGDAAE